MSQNYNCVAPEPFNFSNPGDWPKWIRRFERFRQASGLINNPENEQVNMLVYCMGDNADDILLSCKIASDQLENYGKVIECFESHFIPRRNIIYERARFNQRCQQEGEKVNEFITTLHSLAEHCNFGMLHDELIRDRIVVGVRDRALSERMQLDTDLTLVKATLMAKQLESVKEQQSSLYQQDSIDQIKKMPNHIKEAKRHEPKIRQFKSNQLGGSSHGCTRCGNSNNHDWKNCPAMNSYCSKCKKKGHYAKVCRSEAINEINSEIAFLGSVEDNSKKWIVPIKLDANSGFWQFGLAKESQKLTTFITPFGRFFFKRIPFGITSAPEIFQRKMTQLLGKIEGVVCFMDDIVVYGSSLEEHNERVRQVLKKIQEEGMTLNPEKCQFGVKTVKFLGHTLSSEGLFIDEEKLDAITKMEAPRSTKELKSFLGMVNYLGKFIPNLADKLQPLNSLLSTKNEWVWDEPQKKSFNLLKQELVSRPNLALFDPSRTTIVSADASSFGLGGVLRQEQPDGSLKPIAYVSRTLSETEKRYSQIEKEGLAIVWTCDRLKDYVTGIKIHIETDHKPLIAIFTSKSLEDMTPRLQRLKMRMMGYSYQISHIAGKRQIVADMLSRKPMSKPHKDELEEELSAYIQSIEFPATEERLLEISRKQKEDSLCSQLAKYCMSGWPKNKREVDPALRGYWQFQEDLTYQNGLLLRGQRILIPKSLRKDILEKLHQGHFGINKCRSRAKESVWWLGISQEIERMVSSCTKCLKERKPKHEPLIPQNFRSGLGKNPKFPQSNGFIEAIIKNIKQSFKKEEDCYLTLQAYRTMPLESGYSPAELLMGRRLRTSVPAIESSLMPRYLDSEALQEREKRRVINQKRLYDKRHDVHSLPPLQQWDSVWIRDQRVEGTVLHKSEEPRSYWVQTPQGKVRRNRLHLTPLPKMGGTMDASEEGQRQEQRNEETPTSTSTRPSRRCMDDQEQETQEDCPTPTASSTRDGRMQRDNQDQDPEKSLPSMPAMHTRYGRAVKIPRRMAEDNNMRSTMEVSEDDKYFVDASFYMKPRLDDLRMPGHRKRRQFKQTDAFTRGMVIKLKRAGWSIRQIAADTHLGASTVHRLWRRWLEQGNVAIYRNAGATRVTSARVDRRILRQAVAAPQATCTAILQHVQDTLDHSISTRTISRRLVANGLHSCRPLRRLPLTPPNRRQRLEWCRARSTWMTEWHRVVFSDESRFCLSSDSRRVRVWRRRGERSNPAAIVERPTVRQRGIMVWGAIAYDSRSPLLRIQGTMTAQRYVDDVLRPVTLPYLQGVPNALYQQDNARPHTARISQQALQDVQMLPWPPFPPDLSPIEHVWDIIGRRLHALPQPRSEDELWQMVEREWRAIPQDAIRSLIDSLPRRVAACIAVR
ncbi:K02A2.6-like, partial [Cordylochernes scorpioides]